MRDIIKRLIILQGLKHEAFAMEIGISRNSLYRYLKGKNETSDRNFIKMLSLLGLDIEKELLKLERDILMSRDKATREDLLRKFDQAEDSLLPVGKRTIQ